MNMYFLPIVLFLLGANAGSDNGVCTGDWRKGDDSCYLVNTTAVSRYVAWISCLEADASSSLVVIESNEENNVVGLLADGDSLTEYWTSGTRDGWETWDVDNEVSVFVDYSFENWVGGTRDTAGWTTAGKNGLFVSDSTNAREWNMEYTTDVYKYGFVCEIPLDTCYTGLATSRDTWQRTNIGDTATEDCPTTYDGAASLYAGTQTRECNAQAQFLTPVSTTCGAVVDENGWTDDTAADGFAWTDASLINTDRHGPYRHTTSNSKLFNTANADVADYPYVFISLDVTVEDANGWDGSLEIAIEGTSVEVLHTEAFSGSETVTAIMPRTSFGADTEFTLHLTANMDGEDASTSTKEFYITNLYMEAYSRQDMSEECYRKHSFNESVANPVFVQANSGFMSTADDLTIEFTIPRELYDVTISWENQPGGNPEVGYTDASADTSLWGSARTTAERCGRETWSADIPWTSLTGAFESVTTFNDGTQDITNDAETYYVFTAVLRVDASERTVAYNPIAARDWEQTRTATWRYPLALKWLRDVDITTTIGVFVCSDGATICTIRHVAAIVSFVQTEVDPIAALSNDAAGTVVLGILTKVAYPYMFVSGEALDDPGSTAGDQITNSADTDYTMANSLFENWAPPLVVAQNEVVDTVQQTVSAAMAFQWEDTSSCTHDPAQAVEFQTTKECEQTWTLQITPTGGSCYVNGDYTISFSARCMYTKPVCVFLTDSVSGKYQNGVSTTLTVKSTQMCPSLVEDVDLSGSLCSTGRSQDSLGYLTGCDSDATYVQGEVTHFYTEVTSSIAAIQKTEIIQIYATQSFDDWLTAPANLLPRYDNDYNDKVTIWAEGDTLPKVNTFDPNDGGVTVGDDYLQTIIEVQNSDSSTVAFASNQAGFQVNLNPYIFPAPHDRSTDVTFTVLLRVTYEGFEDFARTTGVLSGDTFGGSNDASWCAATLAGTYGGSTTEFCDASTGYPGASTNCPDICVRRMLRRALQSSTPINGGDDFMQLTTTVSISPAKAEINGYVDDETVDVRFTLLMEVDDEHINLFNVDRPLYYSRMEYKIASLASAIDGQVHCSSIMRIVRGDRQALQVVVDIQQLEGVTDSNLSPAAIAQNLEMMIQTGRIYHDDFFLKTEVYSMQYEAVDEAPDKVHFGEVSPVDTAIDYQPDSASTLSVLLVCLISLFLW